MLERDSSELTEIQFLILELARSLARGEQLSVDAPTGNSAEAILLEAVRQKMGGCVAAALIATTNLSDCDRSILMGSLASLERGRTHLLACANQIQEQFLRLGVAILARKGLVYDAMAYGGRGLRQFGDLDFFLQSKDADLAISALQNIGYQQLDDRKTVILRRLCPDHLPRLYLPSSESGAPMVEVDIALNMSWYGCDFWVLIESMMKPRFANPVRDNDTRLLTLTPDEHFLDCCLHLYREGYFEVESSLADDIGPYPWTLSIRQFLDVVKLWRCLSGRNKSNVLRAMEDQGICHALAWSLFHTDRVLGTTLMDQLNLTVDPRTAYSWRRSSGEVASWSGDMVGRIFSRDPCSLFHQSQGGESTARDMGNLE